MTRCVCSHDSLDHHTWTGACYRDCGCSYFLADNGIEPSTTIPKTEPYTGAYNRKYSLEESAQ